MTGPSSPRVALPVEFHERLVRCRAQVLNAVRVCGMLAAVIVLCGPAASAQDSVSFVRRSDVPTPSVTDIAVVRQQRVDVPLPALLADPERSRVLQLDLFADVSLRAVRERIEPTAHGVSWVGVLDGYPQSTAVFVLVDDELVGHVYAPFGFFRIERQTDGSYLVQQVDQSALPEGPDTIEPPAAPAGSASAAEERTTGTDDRSASDLLSADDGSVIDILVAYTRDALNGFGSETKAQAVIDLLVAGVNQAFRNTGLNTRLRVVRTTSVEYAETGDNLVALERLRVPDDGFLDDVLTLRDTHAADLVAVVTERREEMFCGWAYLSSPRSTGSSGFSVFSRDCTGSAHQFADLIGHNLGADHDWYTFKDVGAYAYSKGHVSLPGRFLDITASYDLCRDTGTDCSRLMAYSNPALTHNGRPTGVPAGTNVTCKAGNVSNPDCDADLARTFRNMAPVVARFRDSRLALRARQILPGGALSSDSGQYRLTYQTDGNLVLYDDLARTALWQTFTSGTSPGQAILQTDGNFVVYDGVGTAHWDSGTGDHPNAYMLVQDDGDFVIFDSNDQPIWSRLTGSLLP